MPGSKSAMQNPQCLPKPAPNSGSLAGSASAPRRKGGMRASALLLRAVVALLALLWLPLMFWHRPAEPGTAPPVPLAPGTARLEDVMVVSQAPGQCRHRGTYFATKAAQTKLQLAQRRGWRLWIAGDESEGLASAAALAAGNDTAAASQLGLLLALHEARPPPRLSLIHI